MVVKIEFVVPDVEGMSETDTIQVVLVSLAKRFHNGYEPGLVMDENGNSIGTVTIS